MIYEEVFKELNKRKVKYVVVGGIALVLYGILRFTADLDLVIHLEEKNIDRFFKAIKNLGFKPKIPVTQQEFKDKKKREEWAKKKNMIVFSFYHPKDSLKIIDVFIKEPIKFESLYKEAKKIKVKKITIPLASLKHLKQLKKRAKREKDLIDLIKLKDFEKIEKNEKKKI